MQRDGNNTAATPLSGVDLGAQGAIAAILEKFLQSFFENPKPRCREGASWIYFSHMLALTSPLSTYNGLLFARSDGD